MMMGSSGGSDPLLEPGFRFYPTEEELLTFYLRHQLAGTRPVTEHLIPVVDIYSYHPSELQAMASSANVSDMEQLFFFCPRTERELHGGRPARTMPSGYWKAVGSPSYIYSSSPTASNWVIGEKRTMIFYEGRAPTSNKTRWRMNEYKAAAAAAADDDLAPPAPGAPIMLRSEFSVCRVYISSGTPRSLDRRPLNPPGGGLAVAAQQAVHCGYQHVQQQQLQPEPLPRRAGKKTTSHHHQQMAVVVDDGATDNNRRLAEEELLTFYLRHQLAHTRPVVEHLIPVVDIYGYHPSELPAMAGAANVSDTEQWFFFCPRAERELQGSRPACTTPSGYWKAVGSPSYIYSSSPTASNRMIGEKWEKCTMIFYEGRAPTSSKTRWRMNEYKAAAAPDDDDLALPAPGAPIMLPNEFSVCRVYISSGTLRSLDRRPLNPPGGGLAVTAQQAVHCGYQHVQQQQLQPEPLPPRAATRTTSHHHQQMVVVVDDGAAVSHSPVQGPGPSKKSISQPKTGVPSVSSSRPKRKSKPNVRITGSEWQL